MGARNRADQRFKPYIGSLCNPHIGSSFDDFLVEEKISNWVEERSIRKVVAFEVMEYMSAQRISTKDMAERLHTSRSQLDRLLDPSNESVTLSSMRQAADVIGKKLIVTLEAA